MEVAGRRERSLALLAGIVLACVSFTVLTATAQTQQLNVHGTIARTFRSSYDTLVCPPGTETQLERTQGLVRANYLSGIFGGRRGRLAASSTGVLPGERFPIGVSAAARNAGRRCCRQTR